MLSCVKHHIFSSVMTAELGSGLAVFCGYGVMSRQVVLIKVWLDLFSCPKLYYFFEVFCFLTKNRTAEFQSLEYWESVFLKHFFILFNTWSNSGEDFLPLIQFSHAELLRTCLSPDAKIEQSKVFLGHLYIFIKKLSISICHHFPSQWLKKSRNG